MFVLLWEIGGLIKIPFIALQAAVLYNDKKVKVYVV